MGSLDDYTLLHSLLLGPSRNRTAHYIISQHQLCGLTLSLCSGTRNAFLVKYDVSGYANIKTLYTACCKRGWKNLRRFILSCIKKKSLIHFSPLNCVLFLTAASAISKEKCNCPACSSLLALNANARQHDCGTFMFQCAIATIILPRLFSIASRQDRRGAEHIRSPHK